MFEQCGRHCRIEFLEARIAPALAVLNPLADLTVGLGQTGADIDLSRLFDPQIFDNGHTIVTLQTNLDGDPATAGNQPSSPIVIELFDDAAPLTVQNFLSYLTNADPKSNYRDTFFHRSIAGFVVQGGGFNVSTPDTHLATTFDVHNEFDGVARSNVRGTIATAKTGLGPNTGNSEWFFNLADNSANLDNQNGGFTVFARVIRGMETVDAIAALETFNFSGAADDNGAEESLGEIGTALNDLPLQNYDSNPDVNPNTPPPAPTPENYLRLTGYTITPPPSGTTGGITFSINPTIDVLDATTNLPSNLVAATITGSRLHLDYKAHAAGVVRVTVHGTNSEPSSAADTFVVNLQPNLVSSFEQDPFDKIVIGGDTKTSDIVIGNNGGGWAVGNVDVTVYLSKVGGTDSNGALLEPDRDFLLGSFLHQSIDLAPGGTVTLAKSLQIPRQLSIGNEAYRVLVQVTPANSAIAERFTDDNISLDSEIHLWQNRFGTITVDGVVERTHASLVYQEADGDVVKLSLTGKGSGQIAFDGTLADLTVTGSKSSSILRGKLISGGEEGEGDIDLHNLELVRYIGSVKLPQAAVNGFISASRGFHRLTLGDLTGDGLISIGKLPASIKGSPSVTLHKVSDFSLESLGRIKSLHAQKWIDTDGLRNRIEAPSFGSISIRGDLEANIAAKSTHPLGSLNVGGFFREATLIANGSIGEIRVGGLDRASIFAGLSQRPDDAGDFGQPASIARLTVQGVAGASQSFVASTVAAAHLGTVFVTGIGTTNPVGKFGLVTDSLGSYNRDNAITSGERSDPQVFDRQGRYSVIIL